MILGLDMGGTHTDAVILDGKKVVETVKILTRHDLLSSILEAIEKVCKNIDEQKIKRIVLSTTLTTNAVVQNKLARTGLIAQPGPGIPKELIKINQDTHFISGYTDHRGEIITHYEQSEIRKIKKYFEDNGIRYAGIVSKFSVRNAEQENKLANEFSDTLDFASLGHQVSGMLNFPRRMNTAFLNASVYEIHKKFVDSVLSALNQMNINAPVYMLKADGGTIKIGQSEKVPAQTITSGPAASIMGILGLVNDQHGIIALDIGGTTTDIAIIHKGAPLLEPEGITIGKYKTLIRALYTRSIGAGGDSIVGYDKEKGVVIGPERAGQPYCMNGENLTPTDAVRYLGISDFGDESLAKEIIEKFAKQNKLDGKKAAEEIVNAVVDKITNTVKEMLSDLNTRPVYTIHELIEGKDIKPQSVAVIGGPASVFGPLIAEKLNCKLKIPENIRVANAIGAAIARTTTEITVHADTSAGYVKCVEDEIEEKTSASFNLNTAKDFAKNCLLKRVKRLGADEENIEIEITEEQAFNMVRGFWTSGQNIRVKAQVKPGIIKQFEK